MRMLVLLSLTLLLAADVRAELTPVDLRTESLTNPVGVDVRVPRFSWRLSAPTARRT